MEAVFEALAGRTDLVVAIGREGKADRAINPATLPLTAAMAAKVNRAPPIGRVSTC